VTSIDEARQTVHQTWADEWERETPYAFEDEENRDLDRGTDPWARLTVREVVGGQETLGKRGDRKYKRNALVLIQIFTPINTGMKRAGELGDKARSIFEGTTLGTLDHELYFNNVQVRDTGPERSGKWKLTMVEGSFWYIEIK